MEVEVIKKDVYWGYFAQFFSIASGIIILPVILRLLTPEEIGLNYLMLTVGGLVILFDFGFAPQFGRNITYIYGGSQVLLKEGVATAPKNYTVNYQLLSNMIHAARFLYKRLSLFVLLILLTAGTFYIYIATDGFSSVANTLIIWLVYCISVYFNMYYAYYSSLLNGKGMIYEHRKAMVYSKVIYTVVALILLFSGLGLISIVIANLITPFVVSFLSKKYFFTSSLNKELAPYSIVNKADIKELIEIIWHNAKKLGLVYLGSFTITKIGIFIAGLYLSLESVASYGIMVQLVGLIAVVASTVSTLYQPRLSFLRAQNDKSKLLAEFSYTVSLFTVLFLVGGLVFVLLGEFVLELIKSSATLPNTLILILYCLVVFLENNHSLFSSFLVTNNEIPMVRATLISGFFITLGSFLILKFTDLGILGIVLVPGIVQASYNNWKWPLNVTRYFETSYFQMILLGNRRVLNGIKNAF